MTIQRQYSLPNCTLILEGLSDNSSGAEARPLMSILVNAECHFIGQQQPLVGGRDFFESLVTTVSRYAQEFLSGIHPARKSQSRLVELYKVNERTHRLSYVAAEDGHRNGTPPKAAIDLTTVQLFDLVEAIDQFLADSQTLPDLAVNLAPVSRRYVKASEPLAKRAVPAVIGTSGLAAAAALLFMLPAPKVQEPKDLTPQQAAAAKTASPSPTSSPPNPDAASTAKPGEAAPTPEVVDPEAAIAAAPAITDSAQVAELEKDLYAKIDKAWQTNPTFKEDLVYRVSVSTKGDIVGYKYINASALDYKDETPLPDLYYKPVAGSTPNQEPIAQYRVVFTPDGKLQVNPWQQAVASPTTGITEITDAKQLEELQAKLYDQVDQNWKEEPTFEQDLIFRVRVKQDGTIEDYQPTNQSAIDYAQETPLSDLGKLAPEDSAATEPLALFKVVFKPNGVLQVSPWRGFRDNS